MIIKNANVYGEDGKFTKKDIYMQDQKFVSEADYQSQPNDQIIDAEGKYAIPGLIDIHFHGCDGYDFCDGTPEAISAMAKYEAKNGVTAIAPASMTLSKERLKTIFQNAAAYEKEADGADFVGVNMEGPFVSFEKKGAQNPAYLHKPDYEFFKELQEDAKGLVKLVDVAPEVEGATEFIEKAANEVTVSIAHSAADYETAAAAFATGANHVTHLYNAMSAYTHREPGIIGAAYDYADHVELICDGIHVHPSVVRATIQMFGRDRVIFISDSMMAAGLDDGQYELGGQAVTVKGNLATLADGVIAGSVTNLMKCMKTAVKQMDVALEDAVMCATGNPARAIGIYDQYGSITPGKIADVVLLDEELEVETVVLRGDCL